MTTTDPTNPSRRRFLKQTGTITTGAMLAGIAPPVHPGGSDDIRLALIGCGGRGSGAVGNAVSVPGGTARLWAMADLFEDKLSRSYNALSKRYADRVEVPNDRKFLGFDAYRHAIDCLRPGDIALCTTHAYCRPTHVEYAVKKGVNVFMEKSFAPDPAGLHRMLRIGELAQKSGVKIATGLMCRHSVARQELKKRIDDGQIGDLQLVRAYRMSGGRPMQPRKQKANELAWQIRHAGNFAWVSSGRFIEWLIHQIDECCWLYDGWPVAVHGMGGRVAEGKDCSQNLDIYALEYTFQNGKKAIVDCRFMNHCYNEFATYVQGTKCAAQFSGQTHKGTVRIFDNQFTDKRAMHWAADAEPCSPWQAEWNDFLESLREDRPHNETKRSVHSNFAAIMGRAAVHTGKIVSWNDVFGSKFAFVADVDHMTMDTPAPVTADEQGRYPAPIPGEWVEF